MIRLAWVILVSGLFSLCISQTPALAHLPVAEIHYDLDDCLMHLMTKNFLYKKGTDEQIAISGYELGKHWKHIGQSGIYADYEIRPGSFREAGSAIIDVEGHRASVTIEGQFLEAIFEQVRWWGPAFELFVEMMWRESKHGDVSNNLLTARGLLREEIMKAFSIFVEFGTIPTIPHFNNYAMAKNRFQNPDLLHTHDFFKAVELGRRLDRLKARLRNSHDPHRPTLLFLDDSGHNIKTVNDYLAEEAARSRGTRWSGIDIFTIQVLVDESLVYRILPNESQPHLDCIILANGMSISSTLNRTGRSFP